MTRIYALILGVALTLSACAHVTPAINAVVTCSGQTVPITLVKQIYADVMADNWLDLADNVVPALKDGWADVDCIFGHLKTSNPETVPHIQKLKAQHADEFKGSVSMRSPGDATPKAGPTETTPDPRGPVACGWRAYMADDTHWTFPRAGGAYQSPATDDSFSFGESVACEAAPTASLDSTKTRGARPALPGADGTTEATASVGAREPAGTPDGPAATFLRAGPTAGRHAHNLDNRVQLTGPQPSTAPPPAAPGVSIGRRAGGSATQGKPGVATRSGESFSYPGPNVGSQAEQCDRTCHEHLTGLATVDGCECHRKINGVWRWVAAR